MATPTEVLDLLAEARSAAGAMDRGRAWAAALRGLVGLPAEDKRDLALLIAERAAPDLVPRIRDETGLELSSEQVETVLDMFRSLDAEDVEDLRRTVADPDAREAALRSTAQATAAAAMAAAGLDDADDEELPPPPPQLLDDGPDGDRDELDDADAALADAERRRREIEEQADRELAEAEAELAAVRAADEPGDVLAEVGEEAGGEEVRAPSALDEEVAPAAPYEPVFEERDPPRDRPGSAARARLRGAATPPTLAERLRGAGTDGARLALLTASVDEVLRMASDQVTEVVRAIPDGWARRRAVERLIEHDAFLAREVPDAVRLLGRASDRTWVAATAVEARLLELDELDRLLEPRAAARLRRRYG